jgi:uncharacterized protein (TIGR03000 family)
VAAALALLSAAGPARAQHHGGGFRGGFGGHAGFAKHGGVPAFHGLPVFRGGFAGHRGGHPFRVWGGWAGFGGPYFGAYGLGYGDSGYPDYPAYSGPAYLDAPWYAAAYPPAAPVPVSDGSVSVAVGVPPDAQVTVQGVPVAGSGTLRRFRSPPLEPGQEYTYTITAEWAKDGVPVTRTRQVGVRAGQQVVVNFLGE